MKLTEHKWEGGICPCACVKRVKFRSGDVRDISTVFERNSLNWKHREEDCDIVSYWDSEDWGGYITAYDPYYKEIV
jgi:hypothetical protein